MRYVKLLLCLGMLIVLSACRFGDHYKKAQDWESKKDYGHALIEYRKAMSNKQGTPETYYHAGLMAEALGGNTEALKYFISADNLAGPKHPLSDSINIEMATLQMLDRDFKGAAEHCRRLLQRNPKNAKAREILVLALTGLADTKDASQELDQWLSANPESQRARMIRTGIALSDADLPRAIKEMEEAAAQPNRIQGTLISLGNLYQLAGQFDKAEKAYLDAIPLGPSMEPRRGLAWLYARTDRKDKAVAMFREIRALQPKDPVSRGALGEYYLSNRMWPDAIPELQRLVKEDPKDSINSNRLASAYLLSNRMDQAEELVKTLLKNNPSDPDTNLIAGIIAYKNGQPDQAILYLNNSLQYKSSAQALFFIGASEDSKGNDRQAQIAMTRALQQDSYLLGARLWLAQYWLRQSSPASALSILEKDPMADHAGASARVLKSRIYSTAGNFDLAMKELRAAQAQDPKMVPAYYVAAMGFLLTKQYAKARPALEDGLKEDPQSITLLSLLARTWIVEGKIDRGVERIKQQADKFPSSSAHFQLLAEAQFAAKDFASSKASYERAIALSPQSPGPLLGLTQTLILIGKKEEAKARLIDLTKRWPQWTQTWTYYGGFMEMQNDYPEAIASYERAVSLDGSNALALNNLAWRIYADGGDIDRARTLAQKARDLQDSNANFADTLGMILLRQGSRSEAEKQLQFALHQDPNNQLFLQHMAMLNGKGGQPGQAQR